MLTRKHAVAKHIFVIHLPMDAFSLYSSVTATLSQGDKIPAQKNQSVARNQTVLRTDGLSFAAHALSVIISNCVYEASKPFGRSGTKGLFQPSH